MVTKLMGVAIALCAISLSGCSNKNEASEKNFKDAINETFKTDVPCLEIDGYYSAALGIGMPMEPDHATDEQIIADKPLPKALADLGLVTLNVVRTHPATGGELPYIKVTLTEKGKPYFRDLHDRIDEIPSLCFGHYVLDSVDRFSQPQSMLGQTLSEVQYTYHVVDVPDWVKAPELMAHSSWLKQLVTNPVRAETKTFILTNKGWEDKDATGL